MAHPEPDANAAIAELLQEARRRAVLPLTRRERLAELLLGGSFVAIALALVLIVDADRDWDVVRTVVLTLCFAVATRIQLDVGTGYTVPTQLAFVPMLLLLPTPAVPLLVAAGWWIGRLPDVVSLSVHPERVLLSFGNSWFALGPAVVLIAGGAQTPDWGDWPWYVAALAVQIAFDVVSSSLREWIGSEVPPALHARVLGWVELIDVLLSPLGLLAAFAAERQGYAFLLLLPAMGFFVLLAREHAHRIADAAALAERSAETAELNARLLVSEREVRRAREQLLAGASAEMLTPLAELTALVHRLRSTPASNAQARREHEREMLGSLARLRHLVGQFIDFSQIKAGVTLDVERRSTDVGPILDDVTNVFTSLGHDVVVEADPDLPPAHGDAGRIGQIVFGLVDNAVKYSPDGEAVHIRATRAGDGRGVELCVVDRGPGVQPHEREWIFEELRRGSASADTSGAGLGLYLGRLLAVQQGGTLTLEPGDDGGSRFVLTLPAAG